MECLTTIKSLKINSTKAVGTVVIVAEGNHDEFDVFYHIFVEILHYQYIEKRRTEKKYKEYNEYVNPRNKNSRFIVINSSNSNIGSITSSTEYLDELHSYLYTKYSIDLTNVSMYFVWDRDTKSNTKKITHELIKQLGNASDNGNDMNGLLLLSYPALESYQISCIESNTTHIQDNKLKDYVKDKSYTIDQINRNGLLKAVTNMHKSLINLGIKSYNTDENFNKTNEKIYNKEEEKYNSTGYYCLLSMISLIFIDLGIIEER